MKDTACQEQIDPVLFSIGSRIASERIRLGLSKTACASVGGVKRLAQHNYETGVRAPDARYLQALAARGMDVEYILTGESARAALGDYRSVLQALAAKLMIDSEAVTRLVNWAADWRLQDKKGRPLAFADELEARIDAMLSLYDVHAGTYIIGGDRRAGDDNLLCRVIERFEMALDWRQSAVEISTKARARAIAMLYRAAKASGSVDPRMIEHAIDLVLGI